MLLGSGQGKRTGPMTRMPQIGWVMFLVSAVLFTWSGVRSGDWLVVWASVVFGLACLVFLAADD